MRPDSNNWITLLALMGSALSAGALDRPNVLWLTTEDMSANHLSCYGNVDIATPHIDALAARGIRFTNAYSNAPQCSPARTTLINGMYASTLSADWHRRGRDYPPDTFLPILLRKAGYYCTNSGKTDYNSIYDYKEARAIDIWNDNRIGSLEKLNVSEGEPFFAVINFFETHMSRVTEFDNGGTLYNDRKFPNVNPATVHFSSYLPHTDSIRSDMAYHLEKTLELDAWVGKQLSILKQKGWEENTIVFFFSDHGGCLPGSKGYIREEGVKVPLIIWFPPKWAHLSPVRQPGIESRLVSFVDFAPTLFSLLELPKPENAQGKAFAGKNREKGNDYVYLFKANQAQDYIPSRGFTDGKFKIIWNYNTAYASAGRNSFQWGMPGMRDWEEKYRNGMFKEWYHTYFFEQMEPIEFYDLTADPDETVNLAKDDRYRSVTETYKKRVMAMVRETKDLGFFPATIRDNEHSYTNIKTKGYDFEAVISAAETASLAEAGDVPRLLELLGSNEKAIRYWAAVGFFQLTKRNKITTLPDLVSQRLNDPEENDDVRIMCAGALLHSDSPGNALEVALSLFRAKKGCAYALFQHIGDKGKPVMPEILEIHNRGLQNFEVRSALINGGVIPYNQFYTEKITPISK